MELRELRSTLGKYRDIAELLMENCEFLTFATIDELLVTDEGVYLFDPFDHYHTGLYGDTDGYRELYTWEEGEA